MYNEQQELLNEVYRHYLMEDAKILPNMSKEKMTELGYGLSQEEFINKCKTNPEFSEKWGLKIEERELSLDEKEWQLEKTNCINDIENDRIIYGHEWEKYIQDQYEGIQSNQGIKIPTKLITITYNDTKLESYE